MKIKKKKILLVLTVILLLLFFLIKYISLSNHLLIKGSSNNGELIQKQDDLTTPLNTVIDVGQDVYVQHDNNNNDIYILSSGGDQTVVYKIVNVTYTANKQWTETGLYIDDFTECNCATSPNDYISVTANEKYFVRLYGMQDLYRGPSGDLWEFTTPILFLDDNNNVIGTALQGTYTDSKDGVEITVPSGATRMHITDFNNQEISIQKRMVLNSQQFNIIKNKQNEIINSLDTNYLDVKNDPVLFDKPDKSYVVFTIDDSRYTIDKFADLFASKNVPLCLGVISDNLSDMASNKTETRLEVALRVQEAGGEILTHNGPVVTDETAEDINFMYKYFVAEKQKLLGMGLDVNGILLAGGEGQIVGSPKTAKWAYTTHKYSDILGEEYDGMPGYYSAYYHWRSWAGNYNTLNDFKSYINELINEKQVEVFFLHDENEVSLETLSNYIDYIKSQGTDKIEIVTYNTLYEKFAKRESDILNNSIDNKTYYVSSDGTSMDGTDINNPTNLTYLYYKDDVKTGDTVLLKRGDTFFGELKIDINKVNNKRVKVSSYGTGDLPTICSYKYIGNSWQKYNNNVYRIDIKNVNNFTGYNSDDSDAFNVAFLEADNGNKYFNKKGSIDDLSSKYDFYSDGSQYLYMYTDTNPYNDLGNLKVIIRDILVRLDSNMEISDLRLAYSGGHAIVGSSTTVQNSKISNCIIENIGGSYLFEGDTTRYGNGIEFYECNALNIEICDNIIRNVYDVAFTMQGGDGSGTNIFVHDNVFVGNSQDSEIWEDPPATGINNYQFYNNISIDQGRGWGYEARPDKDYAAHILFWEYHITPTDIYFHNNLVYNPLRIYFLDRIHGTVPFFKDNDYIKSDYNTYYLADDATIFDASYPINEKDSFISTYNKDVHSTFNSIVPDQNIINTAFSSYDITQIRELFESGSYSIIIDTPKWTALPVSQIRILSATFNPSEASVGKHITWSSDNSNVAVINSETGEVTANSNGTTTIRATDGEKTGTYSLIVNGTLGDIDDDGVDAYDAYRALLISVSEDSGSLVDEDEIVRLDVDRSGEIEAFDAYRILSYSIGNITEF